MTDPSNPEEPRNTDDEDLGAPIAELQDLSLPVEARFGTRVRNGIERRVLAGDLVDVVWSGPVAVLLEFINALFSLVRGEKRT